MIGGGIGGDLLREGYKVRCVWWRARGVAAYLSIYSVKDVVPSMVFGTLANTDICYLSAANTDICRLVTGKN